MPFGTLASFKEWATALQIDFSAWSDTLLTDILNNATNWIRNYTNRQLDKQTFDEKYDGDGSDILVLRQYPIILLNSVKIGTTLTVADLPLANPQRDDPAGILYAQQLRISPFAVWPVGRQNIQVNYDAGLDPIPADLIDAERKVALINLVALNPEEFEREGIRTERVGDHAITFQRGDSFRKRGSALVAGEVLTSRGQMISTFEMQLKTTLDRFKKITRRRNG